MAATYICTHIFVLIGLLAKNHKQFVKENSLNHINVRA